MNDHAEYMRQPNCLLLTRVGLIISSQCFSHINSAANVIHSFPYKQSILLYQQRIHSHS